MPILSFIDNVLLQGMAYGIAVLGVILAFRIVRYPDLTPDGSFLLGSAAYASAVSSGISWPIATGLAFGIGAIAGAITSLMASHMKINRLLAGILTTMIAYSVGYRILGGRPNVGLPDRGHVFELGAELDSSVLARNFEVHPGSILVLLTISVCLCAIVIYTMRSQWGLLLRATGNRPSLVQELQRRPWLYQLQGLALANGLVALSAALVSARQGFADVNAGAGIIITLVAALVIGEGLARALRLDPTRDLRGRVFAAFVGATAYFLLLLCVLRASILEWFPVQISPTDIKLVSALAVIVAVSVRLRATKDEEVLPL